MTRIPFWKVESIGNDFVLVHEHDVRLLRDFLMARLRQPVGIGCAAEAVREYAPVHSESMDSLLAHLSIEVSRRRFGVGSDGLLSVDRTQNGIRMRMFNPDGSEDFCGNGLRASALHAYRQGWVGREFEIEHLGKLVPARILDEDWVHTVIGQADYTPAHVPAHFAEDPGNTFDRILWSDGDREVRGSVLTTGSTHAIVPVAELPSDEEFFSISPRIEVAPQFPNRTSIMWVQELAPMHLEIRIWERGAGETLGCGTGSSAAAADYLRRRGVGGTVRVENPGGSVDVSMEAWHAPISVTGKAAEHFKGEYALPL